MRFVRCIFIMLMLASCAGHCAPVVEPGDRVVFLGDSITQQMIYTRYVMNYFALRYPGSGVTFRNAGWGGDTAKGALTRLQRDVLSLKPDVVTVCFGMNDGGYRAFDKALYTQYMDSMEKLVSELQKADVKIVLLTPGCVDADRSGDYIDSFRHYNKTLEQMARGVEQLAERAGVPCGNIHQPMIEVQTAAKASDPEFTMIADAIHPGFAGQFIMAATLLEAMGCDADPGSCAIDVKTGTVEAKSCAVTDLHAAADLVTFTRTDAALPLALEPETLAIAPYFPAMTEMNYYGLKVSSLADGRWKLIVDGQDVGEFGSDELAKGIDLSARPGPWKALGERVSQLSWEQEWNYYIRWREIQLLDLPAEVKPQVDALLAGLDRIGEARERDRVITPAQRTWKWTLEHISSP